MSKFFPFFLLLTLFSVPIFAQDDSWAPRILPIPEETHDYMAIATWHRPEKSVQYEFEYKVEAAIDADFTQIASSSAWLGSKAWSFLLYPLPIGETYIRIGSRVSGLTEVHWSETAVTEQKGPFDSDFVPPRPKPTAPPRPVIFVHGLNGQPSDWENKAANRDYVGPLLEKGFKRELLYLYPYADYNQDGVYDFQGDINGIAQDLPRAVEELSQNYKDLGGDGKVDIVAFSLGGLVSRSYFASPEFGHKIRKFIDIATPHKGVYIGEVANFVDSLPVGGQFIRDAVIKFLNSLWNVPTRFNDGPILDFGSPAVQQVIPRSDFLSSLNKLEKTPEEIDYYCLYGDIHATLIQKLFHLKLASQRFSLGDLLILPNSATGIPGGLCNNFGFIDEEEFEVKMIRGPISPFLEIVAPIDSLRFTHGTIIKQKEIKEKVADLLRE